MLGPSVLRTLRAIIIVLIGAALVGTSLPPAMAADGEAARASAAIRGQLAERYREQAAYVTVVPFSATARTGLMEADAILAGWLAA